MRDIPVFTPSGIEPPSVTRWWVAFMPFDMPDHPWWHWVTRRWWHIFILNHPKQFQHCFAFARMGDGWIILDPSLGRMGISFIPDWWWIANDYSGPIEYYLDEGAVVVDAQIQNADRYIPKYLPATCVSVVKSLLGIRTRAFTPYGLYGFLLREGHATPVGVSNE